MDARAGQQPDHRHRFHRTGNRAGHTRRAGSIQSRHAGSPLRNGAIDLTDGHASDHLGSGHVLFYSTLGLAQTHIGLILSHAALGTPFVVITVTATLSAFDTNLTRASASLGASPILTFRRVQLPLIAPGVISGALFAFATSFDEVVVVLFMGGIEQRTIPRQMWAGIREQISPTILAVATFLIAFAVLLLLTVEWLRRRAAGRIDE